VLFEHSESQGQCLNQEEVIPNGFIAALPLLIRVLLVGEYAPACWFTGMCFLLSIRRARRFTALESITGRGNLSIL